MNRSTIDLDTFLAELTPEEAARARAAAARIDDLEYAAQRIGQSDSRYMMLFAITGLLTLIGAPLALGGISLFTGVFEIIADVAILLMAASFPVMVLFYSLRMGERTKLDRQRLSILETYFLPHDAIYLPAGPERDRGVIAVSPPKKSWRAPVGKIDKKPGWYW